MKYSNLDCSRNIVKCWIVCLILMSRHIGRIPFCAWTILSQLSPFNNFQYRFIICLALLLTFALIMIGWMHMILLSSLREVFVIVLLLLATLTLLYPVWAWYFWVHIQPIRVTQVPASKLAATWRKEPLHHHVITLWIAVQSRSRLTFNDFYLFLLESRVVTVSFWGSLFVVEFELFLISRFPLHFPWREHQVTFGV